MHLLFADIDFKKKILSKQNRTNHPSACLLVKTSKHLAEGNIMKQSSNSVSLKKGLSRGVFLLLFLFASIATLPNPPAHRQSS